MPRVHIIEILTAGERAELLSTTNDKTLSIVPRSIIERFPYHIYLVHNLPTPKVAANLYYSDDYMFISNLHLPWDMLGGWFREKRDAMLFRMIFGGDFSDKRRDDIHTS